MRSPKDKDSKKEKKGIYAHFFLTFSFSEGKRSVGFFFFREKKYSVGVGKKFRRRKGGGWGGGGLLTG